ARPLRTIGPLATRARSAGVGQGLAARDSVALVDPDLHADAAEGRTRLEEAVLDVGPQRVQRHPALTVELRAAHLGAAQTARDLHPNTPHQRVLHGRLHRLAHRAAEADPAG